MTEISNKAKLFMGTILIHFEKNSLFVGIWDYNKGHEKERQICTEINVQRRADVMQK
jgi:hypothetical protein